jgi:hypothetical protein
MGQVVKEILKEKYFERLTKKKRSEAVKATVKEMK